MGGARSPGFVTKSCFRPAAGGSGAGVWAYPHGVDLRIRPAKIQCFAGKTGTPQGVRRSAYAFALISRNGRSPYPSLQSNFSGLNTKCCARA